MSWAAQRAPKEGVLLQHVLGAMQVDPQRMLRSAGQVKKVAALLTALAALSALNASAVTEKSVPASRPESLHALGVVQGTLRQLLAGAPSTQTVSSNRLVKPGGGWRATVALVAPVASASTTGAPSAHDKAEGVGEGAECDLAQAAGGGRR